MHTPVDVRPEDFEAITRNDVHWAASYELQRRAVYLGYMSLDDNLTEFDRYLRLSIGDEYEIYGAIADRAYGTPEGEQTERAVFLADVLTDGTVAGYGDIGLNLTSQSEYAKNKPVVLGVATADHGPRGNLRREGYGRQRYLAMNAASLLIFGHPLHSREASHLRSAPATLLWESLVRDGYAESYEESGEGAPTATTVHYYQRYRFKQPSSRA